MKRLQLYHPKYNQLAITRTEQKRPLSERSFRELLACRRRMRRRETDSLGGDGASASSETDWPWSITRDDRLRNRKPPKLRRLGEGFDRTRGLRIGLSRFSCTFDIVTAFILIFLLLRRERERESEWNQWDCERVILSPNPLIVPNDTAFHCKRHETKSPQCLCLSLWIVRTDYRTASFAFICFVVLRGAKS